MLRSVLSSFYIFAILGLNRRCPQVFLMLKSHMYFCFDVKTQFCFFDVKSHVCFFDVNSRFFFVLFLCQVLYFCLMSNHIFLLWCQFTCFFIWCQTILVYSHKLTISSSARTHTYSYNILCNIQTRLLRQIEAGWHVNTNPFRDLPFRVTTT